MSKYLKKAIIALLILIVLILPVSAYLFPVYRVYGNGMAPTLMERDLVVALPAGHFRQGDLVAFFVNNKMLIKRVIAVGGQTVDIEKDGTVYVDQHSIHESYLGSFSKGEPDITFPATVPDGKLFVMGDNRTETIDSRKQEIGCIEEDRIAGLLILRIWPLREIQVLGIPCDTSWIENIWNSIKRKLA